MPNLRSPRSASPESFSRTRWYLAVVGPGIRGSLGCLAVRPDQLEPSDEAYAHAPSRPRLSPRAGACPRPSLSPSLSLFLLRRDLDLLGRVLISLFADRELLVLLRLVHAWRPLRARDPKAALVLLGRGRRGVAHVLG